MPLAILDIQHAGRPSRPGDLGASGPAGREVDLVRVYVDRARSCLEQLGVDVWVLTEGEYAERHQFACGLVRAQQPDRAAYVACHLNAGGGDYGLVIRDSRSTGGRWLAEVLAHRLEAELVPPLSRVRASWTSAEADSPFPRAWGCIRGIYQGPPQLAGVLAEPAFLDRAAHQALLDADGLRQIGEALAIGIHDWLTGRTS